MSSSVEKQRKKVGKPAAMKLIVTISEKTYVLGILSFNILKEEFPYHFTYPLDAPVNHFNCDTGEYTADEDSPNQAYTYEKGDADEGSK